MDERMLRYRDLDNTSARAAAWLAGRGIRAGDRVRLCVSGGAAMPVELLRSF
jgi:non-ribosomal peptide synthetase component E (peptide arylation enzyme)